MSGSAATFPWHGALMVCGTASNVGKSQVVAGLCRLLARQGVRVAPFKGQNMALNSAVTADGAEIGRAQEVQARAAGVPAEAAMNPVLLKPTSERASQVVVGGRVWGTLDAAAYHRAKVELADVVLGSLADLRRRFDVVVCEGAGSAAEINLLERDLVNLGLARRAGMPAVVVGDIDRGGVFAHLYGTVALLPPELRAAVQGFVINKFRGDPSLLGDAPDELTARTGVPVLGVLPFVDGLALDGEDSLALNAGMVVGAAAPGSGRGELDVAVVALPRLSNVTDVDALTIEPDVCVRLVHAPASLGRPDLVVLPGTKSTVADLAWLRERGLDRAIAALRRPDRGGSVGPAVLGVCGGYQMMGRRLEDPAGVESAQSVTEGLGWLDVVTRFEPDKVVARRRGVVSGGAPGAAAAVEGYEIHCGRPCRGPGARPWLLLDGPASASGTTPGGPARPGEEEGVVDLDSGLLGTSLHGVLEDDAFRAALLGWVAERRGSSWTPSGASFAAEREAQIDRMADACERHLDLDALWRVVAGG